MGHLHLFKTKSQHDAVYNGSEYQEPWVAYIEDDEMVTYNKPHDYSKDYFTIEALETGNVYFKYVDEASTESQRYMEYSKDGGNTWLRTTNVDGQGVKMTIPLSAGEKAYVRGDNDALGIDSEYGSYFYSDIEFDVFGNIMSLTFSDDFSNKFTTVENMFVSLFYGVYDIEEGESVPCHVINAKNLVLPATTLSQLCYSRMFGNCVSLTTAPELPATTLAIGCYENMFENCTSLSTAPSVLPATTLTNSCYSGMFNGCTSLTTAPSVLPATTLANNCYNRMFLGCTSLSTAPALPATTLAENCYGEMFAGTRALPDTSHIDFTSQSVVSSGGLERLFAGTIVTDSDLQHILPKNSQNKYCLPVTTLASSCYFSMFARCTSLTTAPELPATTLADYCYQYMFSGCTSLTTAPSVLPATTLTQNCYSNMFYDCTSLTTAPVLPATTLVQGCYRFMFEGCTSLNYIKAMFTTTPSDTYTSNWVSGVASTGTFVKNSAATWTTTGINGIPTGWTVQTASA